MLTEKAVLAAGAREKAYKVPDSGGLYLHVSAAGTRTWRFKYRKSGQEKLLVLGRHPEVSLKMARLSRDEAKRSLAAGKDPSLERRRLKLLGKGRSEDTFEIWARLGTNSRSRGGNRCMPMT